MVFNKHVVNEQVHFICLIDAWAYFSTGLNSQGRERDDKMGEECSLLFPLYLLHIQTDSQLITLRSI